MGVLQRFERRIESLLNGAFARAFRSEVQPVEIARALQRECDDKNAIVSRNRTMVPNAFIVELGATDHERLGGYSGALAEELASAVREHADEQRYSFVGPISVDFDLVDDLDTGMFRIRSAAKAGATTAHPQRGAQARGAPYIDVDGMRVALTGEVTVIGRGSEADVRIDDPGVSRRHAELRLRDGRAQIVDLGSTNCVVVDGRRVDHAWLSDGTRIALGSVAVVYRSGG